MEAQCGNHEVKLFLGDSLGLLVTLVNEDD